VKDSIYKLLQERYFDVDEKDWDNDIAKRVSKIYEPIYEYIRDMYFIPSSPTLMNCNAKHRKGTFSSCFILDVKDSIDSIFDSLKEAAYVTKAAGGIGYDFSSLRSKNEVVSSTKKTSGGPLSFIHIFDGMLEGVRQGGARRGAGMAQLSIYHPDILDFINAKKELHKYNRFNFSIRIDDAFYDKLEKESNSIHIVKNVSDGKEHPLVYNNSEVTVSELWNMIVCGAYTCAEPGIFNNSIAEKRCSVTNIDKHVSSNPCAEFTGIPYQSCNLGSIDLSRFVENKRFNWEKFEETIVHSIRFLNTIIDVNVYPLDKIEYTTTKTRSIGLGFMGLAHAFFKKEISYSSTKAIKFTEDICKYMTLRGMVESVEIAKKEGAYEFFDYDTFMAANERFFKNETFRNIDIVKLKKDIKKYGIRNSSITSIAPTGSISYLAETSGGIEPIFALCYTRKIEKENKEYDKVFIADKIFEEYLNNNFSEKDKNIILEEVANNNGSCQKCKLLSQETKEIFKIAGDLLATEHLDILEACSYNISLSVSKTINLPKDCTQEEISEVFLEAHKRGIIGVTIYRDGSREGILIHDNEKEKKIVERHAPKRPAELQCHIYRISVKGEKWIVFIGLYEGTPYEIFAGKVKLADIPSFINEGTLIKSGDCVYQFKYQDEILISDISKLFECGEQESITRLISTSLRHGVPIKYIQQQLSKSYGNITDFNKSILRAFKKYLKDEETGEICEVCGSKIMYVEGCKKCSNPECFWSKCG